MRAHRLFTPRRVYGIVDHPHIGLAIADVGMYSSTISVSTRSLCGRGINMIRQRAGGGEELIFGKYLEGPLSAYDCPAGGVVDRGFDPGPDGGPPEPERSIHGSPQ